MNAVDNASAASGLDGMTEKQAFKALCDACGDGDLLRIGKLLLKVHDPNARDSYGESPVHKAARGGHQNVVKYLRENWGANVRLKNSAGLTPLHLAAEKGASHVETARYLLKHGKADPKQLTPEQETPLHLAAKVPGDSIMCQYLVYQGADPSTRNKAYENPLHVAARLGHEEHVVFFATVGPEKLNLDMRNKDDDTALHLAAKHGNVAMIEALIKGGARPNEQNKSTGETALHVAAKGGHAKASEALIKGGAHPGVPNARGKTPVQVAWGSARNAFP